jgi:NADH:ubiquinone reductase (non-electrogenic)
VLSNRAVIPFGMMVWSTGVKSLDFIKDLDLQHDRNQRILVNGRLQIPGYPYCYALGDCAVIENNALPPVA